MASWLDSLPLLDAEALPVLFPEPGRTTRRLARERMLTGRTAKRQTRDDRKLANARDVLTSLPGPGESLHLLHVGNFDGIDLLLRALELAGTSFPHLSIASLGVNDRSLDALTALVDQDNVGTVTLLLSHYFRAVDASLYGRTSAEITKRGGRVVIARSHAKVWTFGPFTFEGSGNLRGCKSVEQITIFNDPQLAVFHAGWIDELVTECLKGTR